MCKSPALFNSPLNFICSDQFLLLQICWSKVGLGCPRRCGGSHSVLLLLERGCCAKEQPDPIPEEHEALGAPGGSCRKGSVWVRAACARMRGAEAPGAAVIPFLTPGPRVFASTTTRKDR